MKAKIRTKKIYKYTAFFEPAEDGGYIVTVPVLPGCVTQGDTFEEAKKMIKDAVKGYIAVLREDGDRIPVEKDEVMTASIFVPVFAKG